jgi:tetratricopeptide (TPR) repeat protein
MNSIGACQFIAACAKSLNARILVAAVCCGRLTIGSDCGTGLSQQEKVSQFKQLDTEAETAMQQHRPADAIQLYKRAMCLEPNSARAFYGLGVAQAAAGEYIEARESLRTADRLLPTTGMPLVMQARVNVSLKDMDTLKANLRDAAARFPQDAQLHSTLARFLAEQNLFVLALAEAMRSQQVSDDPSSRLQLAVLENSIGAYENAANSALAVEQSANLPKEIRGAAAGIAGLSYESLHKPDQGIYYLREAIELNPIQDNSYLALADLFEQSQRYSEAVDVLQQGRRNIPDSPALLLPLGANLIRAERYKEGADVLRALLRVAPHTDDAYISLAEAARKMGDPAQELAALRDLSSYKPGYPMIHVLIARAMLNQEPANYSQVLNELSLAGKREPRDPDVFFLRGKVYTAMGRYDEAVSALEHSIELRPMEPSPYYQLARLYQKLGKAEMAKEQFERIKFLESSTAN